MNGEQKEAKSQPGMPGSVRDASDGVESREEQDVECTFGNDDWHDATRRDATDG